MATATTPHRLLFCSKSEWSPSIRREHAWARMAAQHGHHVVFVERPRDVRALRSEPISPFLRGLWVAQVEDQGAPDVLVRKRSTLIPGHRNPTAARLNGMFLKSVLARETSSDTSIVCSWPWDWGAVGRTVARRRVFDMADDWGEIMPGRREWFARYYRQIAEEADEIVLVNPDLGRHFPGREPIVIRNGVLDSMLERTQTSTTAKTMIYVGTLTHRFDSGLMAAVLDRMPDWRLDIVGACLYPGLGSEPAPELKRLLHSHSDRVVWHGQLERSTMLPLLDSASVAIVPNRAEWALGQDSMKFYDYAARGRAIVSTGWFDPERVDCPPHVGIAESPAAFAEAVRRADGQSEQDAEDQRRWASGQTWSQRWPAWSTAVLG